jgi:hypothetical protein
MFFHPCPSCVVVLGGRKPELSTLLRMTGQQVNQPIEQVHAESIFLPDGSSAKQTGGIRRSISDDRQGLRTSLAIFQVKEDDAEK